MLRSTRWWCHLLLLIGVFALPNPGYTYDLLSADFPFAIPTQARHSDTRWIRLVVDVEDYYPAFTGATGNETMSAQAILPELLLQVPDRPFRPYIGMGLGLSLNRSFAGMALSPELSRLQESLVAHVGGGFAYHVSKDVALLGGVRYTQFKSTDLFSRLGLSSHDPTDDFSAYMVEFGIRVGLKAPNK
jgi:opacity protein-like surface antigen